MLRRISIFIYFLILTLFSSCKKETPDYNQKANELIQQLIVDESCGCIMEMPKEFVNENYINFNENQLIFRLHLRDRKELDSLERLGNNFILDSILLEKHKIKIVNRDSLEILSDNPNFCKKGIMYIGKPIFDKEYKIAFIQRGYAFLCSPPHWVIYKVENGKWIMDNEDYGGKWLIKTTGNSGFAQ